MVAETGRPATLRGEAAGIYLRSKGNPKHIGSIWRGHDPMVGRPFKLFDIRDDRVIMASRCADIMMLIRIEYAANSPCGHCPPQRMNAPASRARLKKKHHKDPCESRAKTGVL